MKLLIEALSVGIITGFVGFLISTSLMYITSKNFSLKKYHFWFQVFFSYFITGFLIHLLFEMLGLNKWYCKYGNACQNKK